MSTLTNAQQSPLTVHEQDREDGQMPLQTATLDTPGQMPTSPEVAEAMRLGLTMYGYYSIRNLGWSHAHAVESARIGVCATHYANLLARGITPAEITEVKQAGIPLLPYAKGRTNGFAHADLVQIGSLAGETI